MKELITGPSNWRNRQWLDKDSAKRPTFLTDTANKEKDTKIKKCGVRNQDVGVLVLFIFSVPSAMRQNLGAGPTENLKSKGTGTMCSRFD
jgi:hypothetical protein